MGDISNFEIYFHVLLDAALYGFVPIVLAFIAFFYVLDFHNRTFVASKRLGGLAASEE
ncbi:MAG: hypothetical protein Q8R51_00760 [Azonexus sp.]|nr:hypothetical protein [Azonexus sp.]